MPEGRLDASRLANYGRRLRRTHHFWTLRGLSLLLEALTVLDRRARWPLYPATFAAYFRFMHVLLRVAQPLSSASGG